MIGMFDKKEKTLREVKTMKKGLYLISTLMLGALLLSGCSTNAQGKETSKETSAPTETTMEQSTEEESAIETTVITGKPKIEIEIKDYGTIKLELDAEQAPITVTNFVNLVNDGFYDGLTFHRIMKDFMMQGGDPLGTGMGGSKETIKGEFTKNGVDNKLSNTRGAIAMARSQDMNSASSQFFIVHQDSLFLDGDYAVFGYVTEGMDVVDAVCNNAKPVDNNGSISSADQPVIVSIKVVE